MTQRELKPAMDELMKTITSIVNPHLPRDEREAKLIADVRTQCLDAMELLVDAARNPRISKDEIAEAIEKLHGALYWAQELAR